MKILLHYTKNVQLCACLLSRLSWLTYINTFAAAHNNIFFKAAGIQSINNHQVVEVTIAANFLCLSAG